MRVIIEWEGAIAEIRRGYHRAHQVAANAVGWSSLDEAVFWRLLRKGGREANMLPGAKPVKLGQYLEQFIAACESEEVLGLHTVESDSVPALTTVSKQSDILVVSLGVDRESRRQWLDRAGLAPLIEQTETLSADPRRRPAELRVLAANDRRTVVVAASDALIRAASAAELFSVGVSGGPCTAARLHQAGADVVYASLSEFEEALAGGAPDLVRRGLLPPSYD